MKRKNNNKGFTLIEMIVVIAIIAILIAISSPIVMSILGNADNVACSADRRAIENAFKIMYIKKSGIANNNDNSIVNTLVSEGFLSETISCPEGGTYIMRDGRVYCSKHKPYESSTGSTISSSSSVSSGSSSFGSGSVGSSSGSSSGGISSSSSSNSNTPPSVVYNGVSYKFINNGYDYTLIIYNNTSTDIRGWQAVFDYPSSSKLISSTTDILVKTGIHYTITCKEDRYIIPAHGSCTVRGASTEGGNGNFDIVINNFVLRKTYDEINANMIMYFNSKWNTGTPYESGNFTITITNNSSKPVIGWKLEFTYNGDISTVSGGDFTALGNNRYRIMSNATGWHATIPAGGSIEITGAGGKIGTSVSNVTLNDVNITCQYNG